MNEVTQLLHAIDQGNRRAADQLLPLVYDELRRLAASFLAQEQPGHSLQPTALVHEAYLRLVADAGEARSFNNRRHFIATAARAMRQILVDHARRKNRAVHGGGCTRLDVQAVDPPTPELNPDLVALDEALDRLAAEDAQAVELVQLRYFAGLTLPDAADILGVSPRTADRLWAYARAYLHRLLYGRHD
jgi:RNA polymerase sigma factor (TIGR02999 family)